jgi:hypothetical protein
VRKEEDTGWQISGGFGQTRYYGNSSTVLDPTIVTVINAGRVPAADKRATLPCDQSPRFQPGFMARSRTESTDSRFVIRDVDSLLPEKPKQVTLTGSILPITNEAIAMRVI